MPDLSLKWIPQFDFGSHTLQLSYPVTRWNPGARTEGKVFTSSSGIITPVLKYRKYTLDLVLRFLESEWNDVASFIAFGQSGEPFVWHPNAYDAEVAETVDAFLDAPRVATPVKPLRDGTFLDMFTLPVTFSRQSAPWDLEYFRIPV